MKKILIIVISIMIALGVILLGIYFFGGDKKAIYKEVPDDYIAVFYGKKKSVVYATFIYKVDNQKANYGFNYISTNYKASLFNRNLETMATGMVGWTDEVFDIAEKNKAYSYVMLPDDDKKYTISEYQRMFIKN